MNLKEKKVLIIGLARSGMAAIRLLHEIGRNRTVRLITSDNLIRLSALGSGIARTSAREFGHEMDWIMGQIGDILRKSAERSHMVPVRDGKL